MIEYIIALIFLVIISFLDIKTFNLKDGYIPAVLTTSFIIFSFAISGVSGLVTGIFSFLIGLLLVDLDLFHGLADLKVFIACGLLLPSILHVALFGFFTSLLAVGYKFILLKTNKKMEEIPFLPVLLVAYIGIMGVIFL